MIFWSLLAFMLSPILAQPALMDARSQQALLLRAMALVGPDRASKHLQEQPIIHDQFAGDLATVHHHRKCGTLLTSEIASNWGRLSKTTQASLTRLFQRQPRQRTIVSRNQHFEVHFDTTGSHAIAHFDDDGNGVPDYADFVADTYEDVWDLQITQLGYREPPVDDDGRYDIYIKNLSNQGVYGFTWPDPGGTTTASYAEIDNNFSENIYYTKGRRAVQVTAAHEFYHGIQFAYFANFAAGWWQEASATWMEDVAYDDVNDYYFYVPVYLADPEASVDFFSFGSLRPYAETIFAHYVSEVYGPETIRATWESLGSRTVSSYDIDDIGAALPGGFAAAYPRFAIWNYFTGVRHRSGYYEEGRVFSTPREGFAALGPPEVVVHTVQPVDGVTTSDFERVDHFGATYIKIETQSLSGGLRVTLDLDDRATWDVAVLLVTSTSVDILRPSSRTIEIPSAGFYDEIVVIPMVVSSSGTRFSVDYSVLATSSIQSWSDLIGDYDGNGEVGFADFLGFAESFGKTAAEGHDERHDMDANGKIDFSDFLKFATRFGDKL